MNWKLEQSFKLALNLFIFKVARMKTLSTKLNLFHGLLGTLAFLVFISLDTTVRAQNISSLNTGAGYYAANNGAVIVDPNWTVSLLSTNPPGQTPPEGIPNGKAYLVPNPLFESNIGYPINTSWIPNDSTSTWITYSTPTQLGGDSTNEIFQYQLTFKAVTGGVVGINFTSDNNAQLYVNGVFIGAGPTENSFATWLSTPYQITVTAGATYVVDLDVQNAILPLSNPTGARVEFTGDVNAVAVPELSVNVLMVTALGLLGVWRTRFRSA